MIFLTLDQKKKITGEIEALSEVISDLSSMVEPGERGAIMLAGDNFRDAFGVDLVIECPQNAEKYIEQAFNEFNIKIRKKVVNTFDHEVELLGLTLEEYKHLLKGSIILFMEYQKEIALHSPEGKQVKYQFKREFESLMDRIPYQLQDIIYH